MKNIHIIPTDKPTGIFKSGDNLLFSIMNKVRTTHEGFHIYITSEEEIKEGVNQWYLDKLLNKPRNSSGSQYGEKQNVIILTTDQDLIKDGIQAIDDEFLDWFIKNPSCEKIEVESNYRVKSGTIQEHNEGKAGYEYYDYKIIIPSEENSIEAKQRDKNYMSLKGALEPKNVVLGYKTSLDAQILDKVGLQEPKQETLEEAAVINYKELYEGEPLTQDVPIDAFKQGARWQQERMYSKEDMRKCWNAAYIDALAIDEETYKPLFFEDFIEQFKKK